MDTFSDQQPDPLEHLLAAPHLPADRAALRQDLLDRTRRILRRRRRLRPLAWVVALAACYTGGLLTMRWVMMSHPPPGPRPPPAMHVPEPAPRPLTPPASIPQPRPSALALEWAAFDHPGEQAVLYRQAGDRYLDEENDPEGALRCYRRALDTGSGEDLTISPQDSWLLMALKEARQKEKRNAHKGG
jgi:hypothetical protein